MPHVYDYFTISWTRKIRMPKSRGKVHKVTMRHKKIQATKECWIEKIIFSGKKKTIGFSLIISKHWIYIHTNTYNCINICMCTHMHLCICIEYMSYNLKYKHLSLYDATYMWNAWNIEYTCINIHVLPSCIVTCISIHTYV